jgi:hypothetical protein
LIHTFSLSVAGILRSRYLKIRERKRFLFLFRDPADWLWAVFNFWFREDLDSNTGKKPKRRGQWATEGEQYRSPMLFHELIASCAHGGTIAGVSLLGHRRETVETPRLLIQAFGRENLFFGRNEDMLPDVVDRKDGFLDQLSNFTGLERGGFTNEATSGFHNCNDNKGNSANCTRKNSAYAIAGQQSMLPETRQLIYLHFQEECKLWQSEFGIEYPACLNAMSS